jgi:hypothetical protein
MARPPRRSSTRRHDIRGSAEIVLKTQHATILLFDLGAFQEITPKASSIAFARASDIIVAPNLVSRSMNSPFFSCRWNS